ncbi:type IV secretory system conjugative DNA transfer family protein [Brevundimonas variabilis]|uniref:Type IV secretion system protein VirD4 n=1 Tax=Brevundimonas variabilis TaxID=74312 RepID=A0A7W9CJE8_9CAUL|nr:type IV secretory system conjugative DNA transfer family protein [Brevundimonas variabilis]MBB5746556.1 type IV secretion system protein VirD4 [Brevundimonas variabilis]
MTRLANAGPAAKAAAVVLAVACALSLLLLAAALIALAGLGQLTGEIHLERVPSWFWYYRQDPEVRRWLVIGLSIAGLFGLILIAAVVLNRRRPLHGEARWASGADAGRAGLKGSEGIVLGRGHGGLLVAEGPDHVMLYAPTRTGKGVGVVIPNLLTWPHSVVVLDIKRENWLASAGYRGEGGQRVLLFDPLATDSRTARFNPLSHVDRTEPVSVVDELQRLALMLFPAHDQADPFWAESARTGFIGVGGLVAASPDRPFTLGEIYRQLTAGDARTRLPRVVESLSRDGRPLAAPVAAAILDFTGGSENTFASIRQSITSRMGLWLNPRVDAATAVSDFDLRDLRGGRLSLYLGATPDNMLRVQPLYALLFQQLADLNSRSLPGPDDKPTLVVLDEFARLGPAPVLAHGFAWVAGYGFRILAVLQSPSQLRGLYGPDLADEIMTNCGVEVVFAPKELRIAQELSDRLGFYTTPGRSRSRPMGLGSGRRSITTSDQRRALMLPQELMQMPSEALIILKAGVPAVRGRKVVFYRERLFRSRLRPAPTPERAPTTELVPTPPFLEDDPMDFDVIARSFAAEGLPPPPAGSDEETVAAWLDRVVDADTSELRS